MTRQFLGILAGTLLSQGAAHAQQAPSAQEARSEDVATDPEALAPQFGGFCSFAMSLGKMAPGDPKTWAIVNDRLYVNSNSVAKLLWKVVPGRIDAGDKRWQEVSAN